MSKTASKTAAKKQPSKKPRSKKPLSKKPKTLKVSQAKSADKYALYEQSVQAPDLEVDFVLRTFQRLRKRAPVRLREDFAGSACFAKEWVLRRKDHTAEARDLDPAVLAWAREQHVNKLKPEVAERLELKLEDVRTPSADAFDVVVAYNYSFMTFKTRDALRAYFKAVHQSLAKDGVLFMDLLGGSTSQQVSLEPRRMKGFTYIWEQESFDPIHNDFQAHIHFSFPDGSKIERAFSYDWRLWQIVEIRELLAEAGFASSIAFWEDDQGNFRPKEKVENQPSWNVMILGLA